MDDDQTFRTRQLDRSGSVELLLQQIAALGEQTDPATPGSATGKDWKAYRALQLSGDLVEALAGWAVDHVAGLSALGRKMLASQPDDLRASKGKQHLEYVAYQEAADNHDNEARGHDLFANAPASSAIRRLTLRNLVFAKATGWPSWLEEELIDALDALDSGTVRPLLQGGAHTGSTFDTMKLMLEFVLFAQYQAAVYGMSLDEARAEVGGTINKEGETLKSWETRLRGSTALGALEVDSRITKARNGATHVRQAMVNMKNGAQTSLGQVAEAHERRYGTAALAHAVTRWREAQGAK